MPTKQNQKELLYGPQTWTFLAFFLSPILPAIFYYRNCKLLGTPKKGQIVLIGASALFVAGFILASIFSEYTIIILLVEAVVASIAAGRLAKTQLPAFEQMKKDKNIQGGRDEAPLILLFIVMIIVVVFVLPYLLQSTV